MQKPLKKTTCITTCLSHKKLKDLSYKVWRRLEVFISARSEIT